MGGRGASSSGGAGAVSSTGNPRYDSFLNNHANLLKPADLQVGDHVITRLVTEDGNRKNDTWKATGEDSIIGTFEPQNDVRVTRITRTPNTVRVQGVVNNSYGREITVTKTFNAQSNVYTRK